MKLTKLEKEILKVYRSFKTILRDGGGYIWTKREDGIMVQIVGSSKLFKFIKNGEEYSIEELLKGE